MISKSILDLRQMILEQYYFRKILQCSIKLDRFANSKKLKNSYLLSVTKKLFCGQAETGSFETEFKTGHLYPPYDVDRCVSFRDLEFSITLTLGFVRQGGEFTMTCNTPLHINGGTVSPRSLASKILFHIHILCRRIEFQRTPVIVYVIVCRQKFSCRFMIIELKLSKLRLGSLWP